MNAEMEISERTKYKYHDWLAWYKLEGSYDLQMLANSPDSKVHGANMGPNWVLSAPDGPHVGPMNLAIREVMVFQVTPLEYYMRGHFKHSGLYLQDTTWLQFLYSTHLPHDYH